MRSLWYRLTHRPTNLDDCFDLAKYIPITGACLHLRYNELIREQCIIIQLVARFEVTYGRKSYEVENICGGYLSSYSEDKKRSKISRANAKLDKLVDKVCEHGIVLVNSDQKFEYHASA